MPNEPKFPSLNTNQHANSIQGSNANRKKMWTINNFKWEKQPLPVQQLAGPLGQMLAIFAIAEVLKDLHLGISQ